MFLQSLPCYSRWLIHFSNNWASACKTNMNQQSHSHQKLLVKNRNKCPITRKIIAKVFVITNVYKTMIYIFRSSASNKAVIGFA